MKKKLAGTWNFFIGYWPVQMNGNKLATSLILGKWVEVVKWATLIIGNSNCQEPHTVQLYTTCYINVSDRSGVHGSHVPSPTHVSKSQVHTWRQSLNFWASRNHWNMDNYHQGGPRLVYTKIFVGVVWRVGCSFLLDPTLNTTPKPHLQKVLPCRHSCHTWDLRLGIPCEVVSPNFHTLNDWDCMEWPQVTW